MINTPPRLYATGPDGYLLYYNHACATIVGRTPRLGIDRWCVCAAIFTMAGEPTDHDTGPMATVLRDALPLRGLEALIEQPGGKRIAVQPYPTPALDDEGRLVGAINLIVPLDGQLHRDLLAKRYRTLARWISDRQAHDSLKSMADECDQQALVLAPIEPDAPRN